MKSPTQLIDQRTEDEENELVEKNYWGKKLKGKIVQKPAQNWMEVMQETSLKDLDHPIGSLKK